MSESEMKAMQEMQERLSAFVRLRMLALELGVLVVAMDFTTGMAILKATPEQSMRVAAVGGAG